MKNIIVLSSYFYENNPTANGLCTLELVREFINEGNSVDVVCYKANGEDRSGAEIHEIERDLNKRKERIARGVISKIYGAFRVMKYLIIGPDYSQKEVKAYYKECEKICKKKTVDVIVAMFFPIETAMALKCLKKKFPNISIVIYELDSACDLSGKKFPDRLISASYRQTMKRIYSVCDKILVMRSHEEKWKNNFCSFISKLLVTDLPVLYRPIVKDKVTEKKADSFSLIYSGILDKRYRNPKYLIDLFNNEIFKEEKLVIKFYSKGDCEDMLKAYNDKNKSIIPCGYVGKGLLDEEINNADFLLNIGNLNSNSVPSKLIMYLSTGKPIIHFAYNDQDSCLYYLNKYPLSLVIFIGDSVGKNSKKIFDFINSNKDKRLGFDTVSEVFIINTPKYSCDLILRAF